MQDDQDELSAEEPATSTGEYSSLKRQRGDYGEAARRNFEMHAARETARQAQLSQLKTAVEQGEVLSKNAQKRLLKLEHRGERPCGTPVVPQTACKAGDKTRERVRRGMSEPTFSRPVAISSLPVRVGS